MRAKARDPVVDERRRWMALAVTPLGKGCAAKDAAVVTVSAPRPLKKCDRQTHTDTTVHNTHGHSSIPCAWLLNSCWSALLILSSLPLHFFSHILLSPSVSVCASAWRVSVSVSEDTWGLAALVV